MSSSDPISSPATTVGELLKQAAATVYCRPALRTLGAGLPEDDNLLTAALNEAAEARDAKSFSHLYLAALFAGRQLPAKVLELGAALLPEAMLLLHTALRLEGDVAESLAVAVRSGRMGSEREAIAIVAGWLDYERREVSAPPEFLALTRKICRDTMRTGQRFVRSLLYLAAKLSGDPVVAKILNADIERDRSVDSILTEARKCAAGSAWENAIPSSPPTENTLGSGDTVKRANPKAGRNDPCPCGSGRKFKQCCEGKISTGDQYQVEGVTLSEATAHPELLLTQQRIVELRSYELYVLNPKLLLPKLAGEVAIRLARFREISRAIEVLQAFRPDQISINALDEIAYEFYKGQEIEALRWLVDWAPGSVSLSFDMEILLASPPERMQLLQLRARDAFEAERSGELRDHLRRLKDNLKVEHDERNRALRDLRAAQDQLRRASREKPESPATPKSSECDQDTEETNSSGVEWERQPLRLPEYSAAFRESLRNHTRQASATALAVTGRLAGGDPSMWKTVRALKMRPGTLRVRVAGDYRLLFEIGSADSLRLVDFILRRDLDRWLAAGGR